MMSLLQRLRWDGHVRRFLARHGRSVGAFTVVVLRQLSQTGWSRRRDI